VAELIHTEHHQGLVNIIFSSQDPKAIADLLYAWTSTGSFHKPYTSHYICAKQLTGLHHIYPFSPRLQQLIVYALELIGYQPFEQVGVGGFVGLLGNLQVCIKDLDNEPEWAGLLLDIIQSSGEIQHLSLPYWELLVELVFSSNFFLENSAYSPHTIASLEAKEWHKLECQMGLV
jgi:hypothetical protein